MLPLNEIEPNASKASKVSESLQILNLCT